MKYLRTIYLVIISLIGGCEATMSQVKPDAARLPNITAIPNGLQMYYTTIGGVMVLNFYNPQTGQYGLLYPGQYINKSVVFKTDSITINGVKRPFGNPVFNIAADVTTVHFVSPPATPTSMGTAGQLAYDDAYFYMCVSINRWRRIPWDPTW